MCEITGYYRPDMHLEGILAVGHEVSHTMHNGPARESDDGHVPGSGDDGLLLVRTTNQRM